MAKIETFIIRNLDIFDSLASINKAVVENSTYNPKIEGLNPTTDTG